MTSSQIQARIAALTPMLVLPIVAVALAPQFDGLPSLLRGFITGVSIALLLVYCFVMGRLIGAQRKAADQEKLDALDPLGELPRDQTQGGDR